ncbi:uncharacterized protein LOC142179972 [Nicotiana tabacum]|uniref:Uncharacterized protein LOC142179972 n=1 Tax=Nicotiana tabacum TaxID=4097 RepID=A0AC58UBV5_TOBAC
MQDELHQFERNNVCHLVPRLSNRTVTGTRWVFRSKLDEFGNTTRNKDRLVVQGYNQEEGIDYDETFAPVARIEAIRILIVFASHMELKLFQIDVKSAFLNGLQVKQTSKGMIISQQKYIKELLKRFEMESSRTFDTPIATATRLDMDEPNSPVNETMYIGIIGSLLYLTSSKPNIVFSVVNTHGNYRVNKQSIILHLGKRMRVAFTKLSQGT